MTGAAESAFPVRHYRGPRWLGREVPGWDALDARRAGERWRDWRDYLPCARFKVLVLPWNWRLRPRLWLDDLTFSCSASWLLIEVEVFA